MPDFVIAGFSKSGTTLIRRILNNHGEVYCGSVQYFDKEENYRKGLEWYREQLTNTNSARVVGEQAPGVAYKYEKSIERILDTNPDAKLIWSMRDPVDRTYSNYWYAVEVGKEHRSFERAVIDELGGRPHPDSLRRYVARSDYQEQLKPFLENFADEQMHFVLFEELVANMEEEARRLYSFLGVEEDVGMDLDQSPVNRTRRPRQRHLLWLAGRTFGRGSLLFQLAQRVLLSSDEYPPMSTRIRDELGAHFKDQERFLRNIGIEVGDAWSA